MERTLSREERQEIVFLHREGYSVPQIANQLHRSSTTIDRVLTRYGMGPGERRRSRRAKVVTLHKEGKTPTEIARETGYTRQQVYNIIKAVRDG